MKRNDRISIGFDHEIKFTEWTIQKINGWLAYGLIMNAHHYMHLLKIFYVANFIYKSKSIVKNLQIYFIT